MPVTARLSRRFYDAIGDDAANDLVNWMNAVDLTYRNELVQVNEANFVRFTAALDHRFAVQDAKLEALSITVDRKLADFESRMLKWMLVFWTTTMLGAAATVIAVLQAR